MARIGIITFHHLPNYGAAMQAWGLQQCLRSLGHEPRFIDYQPAHHTTGGAPWWPTDAWRLKADLVIAAMHARALRQRLRGDGGKTARFQRFHAEHLQFGPTRYRSNGQLRRQPPEADAYICGSDQVWNASRQFGIDPAYFLDWAPAGTRRIAYAASFGRRSLPERFRARAAAMIGRLDAVSVRERSAVDEVRAMTGREPAWTPDPTLLVDHGYPEAVLPGRSEPYLFSYTLRSRELVADVERHLSEQAGLPVVSPDTLAAEGAGAPGPLEWLGYIKAADRVITNSYHGTLFSIIFRKPFVFVALGGQKADYNERARSLLERLALTDRMVFEYDCDQLDRIAGAAPDWQAVDANIRGWREQARRFLADAIASSPDPATA